MDNLYFIPNNILTNFFKELTQKKKKTINSFFFWQAQPKLMHS